MNLAMLSLSHLNTNDGRINPSRTIESWYDLLTDPFSVIKKKCKSTSPAIGEEYIEEEVCYIAGVFTEDKIISPSFADEKDKVLNNIILDSSGELLQMYFMTNRNSEALPQKGMFKICVREYKKGKEVIARKFIGRLQ